MEIPGEKNQAQDFLDLIRRSKRGKLKIYVGMSAGVGKTYRMLQDAHALAKSGVDVKIGYIETHNRAETHALTEGLPVIPRRKVFYKGKELEELDVQAIINDHPQIVLVDELAHTNIPGSRHEKRWQDVLDLLEANISVISAVNIQHIETISEEVRKITGIEIRERVPDRFLQMADEVVNIDLTAEELIARLKDGKIYDRSKVEQAMNNFFRPENILQLRELALKEVAMQVERKVESEVKTGDRIRHERFLACISSNEEKAGHIIRKTARLAAYYNSEWFLLYVQTPSESDSKISLAKQRHLINHFKLATELGATIIRVKSDDVGRTIMETAEAQKATTVCIGVPEFRLWQVVLRGGLFNRLLQKLKASDIDLVILS